MWREAEAESEVQAAELVHVVCAVEGRSTWSAHKRARGGPVGPPSPCATDGGNNDDAAHHRAAILALWSSHCQANF